MNKLEDISNDDMKAYLKSILDRILDGDMIDTQAKESNKAMLNIIKFSKEEIAYRKLPSNKKTINIFE